MRLLICTQVMDKNDPVLGFFHRWVEEFAKHYESVIVICLKEGKHTLPPNVRVLSLGKESGVSRIKYISRFYSYIWNERNKYDAVFVHMNQIYVLLGALLWRGMGKHVGLWYVHSSVTLSLRAAVLLVNDVFTTSAESFRIQTPKRHLMGHGIDLAQFTPRPKRESDGVLQILTTGRVSSTKRIKEMVDAVEVVVARGVAAHLTVVGAPVTTEDKIYAEALVQNNDANVTFIGPVLHEELPVFLSRADVFLNLSTTGSMDKAVLEALAMGIPVVTSNHAFQDIREPRGLFISQVEPRLVGDFLIRAASMNVREISDTIRKDHSLENLISNIVMKFS